MKKWKFYINMKIVVDKIKKISLKIRDDNVSEYAAEAAFFTILSFIPFSLFFLTLIKFTSIEKETIYVVLREFVPSTIHSTIQNILEEIYSKSVSTITFSLIIASWSAGKGFFSLIKGLRKIYEVKNEKNFALRIKGSLYTIILIFSILTFLFLIVLGKEIYIFMMSEFHQMAKIIYFLYNCRIIFSVGLMYLIFLFLYKSISMPNMKKSSNNFGALFASIAWQIISYVFSKYIEISEGFTNMYGSFSSIIFFMIWVYACMYIILLGAEINIIFEYKKISNY